MSPSEFDQRLEEIIRELTLRIVKPLWTEFDTVWEAAIRVCDRYELGKSKHVFLSIDQPESSLPGSVTSLPELFAAGAPAQTLPPTPSLPGSPGYVPAAAPPSTKRRRDSSGY